VKTKYEKDLDEFYDLDDDDEYGPYDSCLVFEQELILTPPRTNEPDDDPSIGFFMRKLESDRHFIKVWDTMSNDPEEVKKLKELFGTEFNHIHNHYLKIKNTK
jgi:hypothetical protein